MWSNIPETLQRQMKEKWVFFHSAKFTQDTKGVKGEVNFEMLGYAWGAHIIFGGTPQQITKQLIDWLKTYEKPTNPIGGYVDLARVESRDFKQLD